MRLPDCSPSELTDSAMDRALVPPWDCMRGAGVEMAAEFITGLLMAVVPGMNWIELLGGEVEGGIGEAIVPSAAPYGNGYNLNFYSVCKNSERVMWCVASISVKLESFWSMYDSFWKLGLFFEKFFLLISRSNCISSWICGIISI